MTNTAVIAGAGIAGLSTAIALAQAGWAVNVLERGRPDAQLGAGLQVSANGFKVLDALGVATSLTETMFEPTHLQLRLGRSGRQIFALPIKSV
ncbi:MAG: FAD-dependent oxidoreductase, partial [Planktomarina sp.]